VPDIRGDHSCAARARISGSTGERTLSNFGTVSFTDAAVDNTAIGNENPSALTMISATHVTEATPSALAGGSAFTMTWDSSGITGVMP
jgi:hypothetical protein